MAEAKEVAEKACDFFLEAYGVKEVEIALTVARVQR